MRICITSEKADFTGRNDSVVVLEQERGNFSLSADDLTDGHMPVMIRAVSIYLVIPVRPEEITFCISVQYIYTETRFGYKLQVRRCRSRAHLPGGQ